MIRRSVLFLFLIGALLSVSGCGPRSGSDESPGDSPVVTVNNYTITKDEFESEFKNSSFASVDTPESRQNFLNTLVDRKLLLQYAQPEGLDKEQAFLKTIEKFWEQSLLKVALDRKTREMESQSQEEALNWEDKIALEAKMMNDWMNELRKNARIVIKDAALNSSSGRKEGK